MAGIPFLHNIDLNENQLLNAKLHTSGTAPSSPGTGTIWYDSTNSLVKIYDSGWNTISGDITRVNITAGNGLSGTSVDTTAGAHTQTLTVGAGTGITVNSGDIAVTAAQTGITSILNSNLVIGKDDHNQIDFSIDNQIKFKTNNETPVIIMKASGEIEATKFDGALEGNADTATALATGRTIAMTGDVNWTSASFDGSGNVTGTSVIQADAVHATMINDDLISGSASALTSGLASTDEFLISDAGTLKNMDVSVLQTYLQSNLTFTTNTNTGADMTEGTLRTKLAAITENVTIGDATDVTVTTSGDLVITGDLTVSGDTITANVGTLDVEDKNITVNKSSGDSSSTANGAGLTIQDAVDASTDATMLWDATNDEFDFSHAINITGNISTSGTIELGHATDTTLSRVSSGDVNIEGNIIYRAGGTDVAIADGGTGASTAAAAFANLKQAATTSATGVVELATTTEASTGTDSSRAVTADGLQQFHNDRNKSFELDNSASGVASSDNITYTITHGMGASRLYKVEIIEDATNYETVYAQVRRPSDTTITIVFASAVTAGAYRALVTKI